MDLPSDPGYLPLLIRGTSYLNARKLLVSLKHLKCQETLGLSETPFSDSHAGFQIPYPKSWQLTNMECLFVPIP